MNNKAIYQSKIKALGPLVETFKDEGMIILFGKNAPDTLADYCYSIEVNPVKEQIKVGQTFVLDGISYKITAVGDVAERNLESLGHITLAFTGATQAPLPGTICVEQKEMPDLKAGSKIYILA